MTGLDLVKYHFKISGGILSDVEITFKETRLWNEAKRHALLTVEKMILITNNIILLVKLDEVKKEIEKL